MGTRGCYGFRINKHDKVTYNPFDSYPKELGYKLMCFVAQTQVSAMERIARRIKLVDRNSIPPRDLIVKYKKYADLSVSEQKYEDWYCLLRKTQGDLGVYRDDLEHMIDDSEFLDDSLFCEWAYIINLDTSQLEAYRGFNKNPSANGRYAHESVENSKGYFGVELIKEIELTKIDEDNITNYIRELESITGYGVSTTRNPK